ncbi:aldehyde dehydrogenase family protein [Leucobacter sp. M11]|uniref:aldehyde dehydrogenase family protein n=1 Tax=Leucobacter sp. M11 TaxID=2993565 RepID=UPI002D7FD637|nr:aldehyde dehydrogenase family protein [Leucobacter sp. M11]MEB4615713.1 aldehyde dehydrogenase family protein [Leucobacter sp. M11]
MPALVAEMRAGFRSGLTRPLAWRREQLAGIRRMLVDAEETLEAALAADLGKSPVESQVAEIGFLISEIDHTVANLARWAKPRRVSVPLALQPAAARVRPEPLGTVLVIAPWNYPLMLSLSPAIGAIAAGNAVVIKPSELAPAVSHALATLLPLYLDRRAIAVVEGAVPETTELLAERFDHIFYTGNGRVGRIVAAAAAKHLTPVTLELGGKSPAYVDATVDLPAAAKRIAWAKFLNCGQTCVAPDYVLGDRATLDRLAPLLAAAVHDLYGSQPARNPDYGRIVTEAHLDRLLGYLGDGTIVTGGDADRADRFLAPTVLAGVSRDAAIMSEEIFGPILPLVAVEDLSDAIAFVAERDKPLSLYVFSEDAAVRRRWEAETSSGALAFNAPVLHLTVPELPFGGVGESGTGSYHGERSFLTFSHEKAILSKPLSPDTLGPTIMPPFTERKEGIVRRLLGKLR